MTHWELVWLGMVGMKQGENGVKRVLREVSCEVRRCA